MTVNGKQRGIFFINGRSPFDGDQGFFDRGLLADNASLDSRRPHGRYFAGLPFREDCGSITG